MSVHALLVEAPGLNLVVDTCVGNDRPREITGGEPMSTAFLQHLGVAGWSRDGVDAVVCTHLHVDHVCWNTMLENGKWVPTFPRARYLIGRAEYEFMSTVDDEEQQAMLGDSMVGEKGADIIRGREPLPPQVFRANLGEGPARRAGRAPARPAT